MFSLQKHSYGFHTMFMGSLENSLFYNFIRSTKIYSACKIVSNSVYLSCTNHTGSDILTSEGQDDLYWTLLCHHKSILELLIALCFSPTENESI